MRPTMWLSLLAFFAVAMLVRGPSNVAAEEKVDIRSNESRPKPASVKPTGPQPVFTRDVDGFGKKDEDAREDAIENACKRVSEFLASEHGETNLKVTEKELRALKIIPPLPEITVTEHVSEREGNMRKATLQLSLMPDQVKSLREMARHERVVERQKWAGLGLSGLVALLLVSIGYLRMEEATKGYYTTLLRLSAAGILALVGVFIWRLS